MTSFDKASLERLWQHIISKLGNKVDKVNGKGLSENDYTTTEKNKLSGIEDGATKTVVDSALNSNSTNPIQNKVVSEAISNLNELVGDSSISEQISTTLGSYVVPVALGGTGATDAATALSNLGAAPSEHYHNQYSLSFHSHNAIGDGSRVMYTMDNGDTPCIVMENNGQSQFALSRDALSNQNLGYHVYTDGAWTAYHTLFSGANLSFVLDGTTLNITKS